MRVSGNGLRIILCYFVAMVACSSDGTDVVDPPADLVAKGWAAFEAGDYSAATTHFSSAIAHDDTDAEAHNGLGWTYLRRSQLATALQEFDVSLTHGHAGADPHGGRAIALRDIEPADYDAVITAVNAALAIDVGYVFDHDASFDWHDLLLLIAESQFALGAYSDASAAVVSLGGDGQDALSPTYVADLLAEIERLSSVFAN